MGWLALNFTDLGNVYWDNKETLEDKLIVNYLNVSNINADDMYILYDAASDERKQKSITKVGDKIILYYKDTIELLKKYYGISMTKSENNRDNCYEAINEELKYRI